MELSKSTIIMTKSNKSKNLITNYNIFKSNEIFNSTLIQIVKLINILIKQHVEQYKLHLVNELIK